MAEVGAKSERVEQELKGKLLAFIAFFYFFMVFFSLFFFLFFCLKRRRCQKKAFETEGQKWEGISGTQK
jgi:hypothetical protein